MTEHRLNVTVNQALLRAAVATAAWRRKKQVLVDARLKVGDWITVAHAAGAPLREIAERIGLPLVTVVRLKDEARVRAQQDEAAS